MFLPPIRGKEEKTEEFGEDALDGHDVEAAVHHWVLQRGVERHDHRAELCDESRPPSEPEMRNMESEGLSA